MGLGAVLTVEHRTVTLAFLATGETRTYAKNSAPLTRVIFSAGDVIQDHLGQTITVTRVEHDEGI